MFELTNAQRKCFALPPVLDSWKRVEVKAGPHDEGVIYAFLDGKHIVKVIHVSDVPGRETYWECTIDEMLSDDGTRILPKTEKGKPQNFSAPNLLKKTTIGMALSFDHGYVDVINTSSDQRYYRSAYHAESPQNLCDFSNWVEDWCRNTAEQELDEIQAFSQRKKVHQKFKEGDFFRYRIKRGLYGYGRIFVDYARMRKEGEPFWDMFMGKPLCVAVYHIATEDADMTPEQLVCLNMLPSQMVMDNIFHYGECEIIGNLPISPDEDNYTVHYGRDINVAEPNRICYQCGKTYAVLKRGRELYRGFNNAGIRFDLEVELPVLLACIEQKSNDPYWEMIRLWKADQDLRNPKFKRKLKRIKKQMGVK